MPYFSSFWYKNYKDLRNCCMTQPLKQDPAIRTSLNVPPSLSGKQIKDLIDLAWMRDKQLKWFGWDVNGWYAWVDPKGMIYRLRDLKRNENGKKFEKEVTKIIINSEPRDDIHATAKELYQHELNVQKECGLCPKYIRFTDDDEDSDDSNVSESGDDNEDDSKSAINENSWQEMAAGAIPDFSGGYGGYTFGGGIGDAFVPGSADVSETVYTDGITDTSGVAPQPLNRKAVTGVGLPGDDVVAQSGVISTSKATDSPTNDTHTRRVTSNRKPSEGQEKYVDNVLLKESGSIKRDGNPQRNIIVRFIFEGEKDKDGNRNDVIIEETLVDKGNDKDTDVYVVYAQGYLGDGKFSVRSGSIIKHWLQNPIPGMKKDIVESLELTPLSEKTTVEHTYAPPVTKIPKFTPPPPVIVPIRFGVNSSVVNLNRMTIANLQGIANSLNANPNRKVTVTGNSSIDATPQTKTIIDNTINGNVNQLLIMRANAVIKILINRFHVNPNQINPGQAGKPKTTATVNFNFQ